MMLLISMVKGLRRITPRPLIWLRLSADQGNAEAQRLLANMYKKGQGVNQDCKEALRLLRLVADQGSDHAKGGIGRMYKAGEGVKKKCLYNRYHETFFQFKEAIDECIDKVKSAFK